ncbi:PREDICTED: uncharacterized protein LOC104808670 [Tarenaya hassleriana]|uniref:uncharacterized protein LOC104808670 n=1 Tax=Tarenaya hassleriana TaxID=28532 RepID=UPI00053C448A|nr:PREDICTED: uncharacterized protein LOC104808670 [Tarenaya hassleriana]
MALRLATIKRAAVDSGRMMGCRSWSHVAAMPPPMGGAFDLPVASTPLGLPEFDQNPSDSFGDKATGFGLPSFSFGGSMELMAVPKKKVSRHKRGIRNGPKALKPTPVIIRCRSCGRVKLPHFYCCSGDRGSSDGQSNVNN